MNLERLMNVNICNNCKSLSYAPREKCDYCGSLAIDEIADSDLVMCLGWECGYKTTTGSGVDSCPECGAILIEDNESDEPQFDDGWY